MLKNIALIFLNAKIRLKKLDKIIINNLLTDFVFQNLYVFIKELFIHIYQYPRVYNSITV